MRLLIFYLFLLYFKVNGSKLCNLVLLVKGDSFIIVVAIHSSHCEECTAYSLLAKVIVKSSSYFLNKAL